MLKEKDGKSLYILQRHFRKDSEEYWDARHETTFAATDGSWAVTYEDSYDWEGLEYEGYHMTGENVDPDTFAVFNGEGWGVIDYSGRLVYPCKLESAEIFNSGVRPFWDEKTQRYGYLDLRDRVAIPAQFAYASPFFGEYAFIGQRDENDKYLEGVINRQGDVIVPPEEMLYGYFEPLDERHFEVHNNRFLLMNSDGEVLVEDSGTLLQNGWLFTRSGYRESRLEKDGEVIELPYNVNRGLPGDRFLVSAPFDRRDDEESWWWGVSDKDGALLRNGDSGIESLEDVTVLPSGRLETFRYGDRAYGLLDTDGTVLIPPRFAFMKEFGEYYAVKEGMYGGLVDKNGTWILKLVLPEV
jgi:hypothetical protein